MQEVMLERDNLSVTRENINAYLHDHDVRFVAEDAVFKAMDTGQEIHGREAVGQFLHYFYQIAFDAHAEFTNTLITENCAVAEFNFIGKNIGEFAGMPPTNKDVNVPTCVIYDIENGLIKRARIYMPADVLAKQLAG
jgi:steroid delta-isomerase-like uncharacterized protein